MFRYDYFEEVDLDLAAKHWRVRGGHGDTNERVPSTVDRGRV